MRERLRGTVEFVVQHIFWLVSCAGTLYLMLQTRSALLYGTARLVQGLPVGDSLVVVTDNWSIILIAIAAIVCVVMIEYFYMHAKSFGNLVSRFLVVTGIELLVMSGISAIVGLLLGIDTSTPATVLVFTATLVSGTLMVTHLVWFPRLFRHGPRKSPPPESGCRRR